MFTNLKLYKIAKEAKNKHTHLSLEAQLNHIKKSCLPKKLILILAKKIQTKKLKICSNNIYKYMINNIVIEMKEIKYKIKN